MLFRRRTREHWGARLRVSLWPRRSWQRSASYYRHRLTRLSASPHAIAAGAAAGVFAAFTPFIGLHFLLALALAFVLGGNMVAAALGMIVGNPLTYPVIWMASYGLGHAILGGPAYHGGPKSAAAFAPALLISSFKHAWPLLKPLIVGGVILGALAGLVTYLVVRPLVVGGQAMRRARLNQVAHGARQGRRRAIEEPETL